MHWLTSNLGTFLGLGVSSFFIMVVVNFIVEGWKWEVKEQKFKRRKGEIKC